MSIRNFLSSSRSSGADRTSLQSDRPPTYASNVTPAPSYAGPRNPNDRVSIPTTSIVSSPGSGTMFDDTESSLADSVSVIETSVSTEATQPSTGPRYGKRSSFYSPRCLYLLKEVHYRVYAEDGPIPSKTSTLPDDPFLGRVKAMSIAPPHTVVSIVRGLMTIENIEDSTPASLFLTPSSQSPMDSAGKVTILHRSGAGFMPQEPLALVVKLSDAERSNLELPTMDELSRNSEHGPHVKYRTPILFIMSLLAHLKMSRLWS